MLKEEGRALFDARSTSLGHTLQGGVPSPMDRARDAALAAVHVIPRGAPRAVRSTTWTSPSTYSFLMTGASLVYTPERGMDLDMLRDDVKFLKLRYGLDAKGKSEGRLVIRNESASTVYTTEVITKMLKEEGRALFDARSASLGHTLQGEVLSPMDRVRLGAQPGRVKIAPPESAAVITIQGSALEWVPVQAMVRHADVKHLRGKVAWWAGVKALVDALAGWSALLTCGDVG